MPGRYTRVRHTQSVKGVTVDVLLRVNNRQALNLVPADGCIDGVVNCEIISR